MSLSLFDVPHSTNDGHAFTCPNCADTFANSDDVIRHLSASVICGQRVVQGVAPDFEEHNRFSQDYLDDPETDQEGTCFSLKLRLKFSMYLVYGEYFDPLDDVEEPMMSHVEYTVVDSACDTPLISVDPSAGPRPGTLREYHPNIPITKPGGQNHLQRMDDDEYATIRHTENIYYPFASKSEFDLAGWLSRGALSQKEIDAFLHLEHVSHQSTFLVQVY